MCVYMYVSMCGLSRTKRMSYTAAFKEEISVNRRAESQYIVSEKLV